MMGVEVMIDRKITSVVVEAEVKEGQGRTRKTTLRSERRSVLKRAEKELDGADIVRDAGLSRRTQMWATSADLK
jgi:hypothetical protein